MSSENVLMQMAVTCIEVYFQERYIVRHHYAAMLTVDIMALYLLAECLKFQY